MARPTWAIILFWLSSCYRVTKKEYMSSYYVILIGPSSAALDRDPLMPRPCSLSGTVAPTGLIRSSFNSAFQGEYGKIGSGPSFATVLEIQTIQRRFSEMLIISSTSFRAPL